MRKLFLLLALIMMSAQSAWALDPTFWINDVGYYIENGAAVVLSYRGNAETLTIPESVSNGSNTYKVKEVQYFSSNMYGDIYYGSVDISSVKTLIFEGPITFIGRVANPTFTCPNLEDIIFKGDVPILSGSFDKYFGTRRGITAHITGKTNEEIEAMKTSAAVWCDFEDIVPITDTLTEPFISFADNIVKDICVNNWDTNHDGELTFEEAAAVTSLGEAFKYNTQITKFNELQYFTGLTSIKAAFYGCSALEEVVVPYGVTNMRESFGNCNALKNVVIPPTVNNIERAFSTTSGPTALEHVTLPSSLTKIGEYAFASSGLKSIEIPEGVTEIGTLAFSNCKNLKMVYIPKSVTTIAGFTEVSNNLAFNACSGLESIVVDAENPVYESPNGCNAIIQKEGKKLIVGSKYTVIPEDVVTLDGYSFRRVGLTSIVIPASVTTISSYCFYQCASLTSVECKSPTPPTIAGNVFTQINSDCVLKVPHGCSEAYSAWSQYFGGGIVEAKREVTWSIHNATEGDVIVEQTLKDGTTETTTYAGNLNDLVIDDTQVSKVTLKVYAENANESKPVRVLVNGQDVSYQFSTKQNDGDGFRLCYEVPVSELTNCSWDISYNTDRPQTFVVKGGTCNLLMEFYYENLEKEPVLDISPNDGPATVYLPPFNSEWNRYVNMTVNADEYEGLTIKRNGIDVTNYFTKTVQSNGKKYYELDINDADFEGDNTVSQFGFDIRDAAVWEIVYKSIDEQETKFSIINHDQLALRAVRSYVTGGAPAIQPISQDHYEFSFNDDDRENTTSLTLKVPIKDANNQYYPVRVLRNGVDVTFDDNFLDEFADDYLIYKVNMRVDETWDISRDTSHRQTFIRKGGTTPWNVEVEFDFPADGDERCFSPDAVGTPLYVDFPAYHSDKAPYAYIDIDVEDGSTFTVLRNGVDVTDKFTKVPDGASEGFTRYALYESDYNVNNDGMTPGLGFTFRDPAVWEITIDDGNSDAVEYMFIGDYDKVYASADYNNDVTYEGSEFTQVDVVGYYNGKVVENGQAANSQGAVEFWLPAGKTFRAFYDGTDMTNQFTDYYNNGHWLFVSEDDWMHQPGHHWTIIAESDLMKYDTNRDGQITIADVTKLVNKILGKE